MVTKVPVGTATVAGLGTTATAFGLAVANYLTGDRSQETYAALAVGTIALVTTLVGRFAQAVQHAKASPVPGPTVTSQLHTPINSELLSQALQSVKAPAKVETAIERIPYAATSGLATTSMTSSNPGVTFSGARATQAVAETPPTPIGRGYDQNGDQEHQPFNLEAPQ